MQVRIKKINMNARVPTKYYETDAGFDLYSVDTLIIPSKQTVIVHTGICIETPPGFFGKIESRSSLALTGIFATGGVIDSGYKDELMIILNNFSHNDFKVITGDRIAQIIFHRVEPFEMMEVKELEDNNDRGGGFGSSGS